MLEVRHGAHRKPSLTQTVEIDLLLDSLPDMACRLPMPHYVGNICRCMIERSNAQPRLMRRGDEGIARPQARAHDAELAVALRFEPVDATANVDNALAHGVERASNVGGDGVVGASDLGGHANVVVRHREP